ncbi:MAG: copper-binding protein [Candidatus Adiutrix sp.]|jgi:Cu(I)/Ag(I) efflux system protein CusF|nr:copper-binding protein [Candidatus Adiutrix sp.]
MNLKPLSILTLAFGLALSTSTLSLSDDCHRHGGQAADAPAGSSQTYTTKGLVKEVNPGAKKITISHEAIPDLSWPPMTMGFVVESQTLLDNLKAGDKVRFDFQPQGDNYLIQDIEIVQ